MFPPACSGRSLSCSSYQKACPNRAGTWATTLSMTLIPCCVEALFATGTISWHLSGSWSGKLLLAKCLRNTGAHSPHIPRPTLADSLFIDVVVKGRTSSDYNVERYEWQLWGASGDACRRQFAVEYNRREPARTRRSSAPTRRIARKNMDTHPENSKGRGRLMSRLFILRHAQCHYNRAELE